jgi:major membrane immunogen (membrane-anchored lipoprotein)
MKKIFILLLIGILIMPAFFGCSQKGGKGIPEENTSDYQDGVYHAIYDRNDVRNWKAFVDITIEDGQIVEVYYDYINDTDELRSKQQGYIEGFSAANGYTPREGFDELANRLIKEQDIEKVDAVSGATHSSRNFNELSAAALEKAREGDTSDTIVALYDDGTYRVEADAYDEYGWKPFVELEISDHNITGVNFDSVNEEGKLKSDDAEYRKNMEAVTKTYPQKYQEELEQKLLDKQVISLVDAVTGATTSSTNFTALVEYALDDMAEVGETGTKSISLGAE